MRQNNAKTSHRTRSAMILYITPPMAKYCPGGERAFDLYISTAPSKKKRIGTKKKCRENDCVLSCSLCTELADRERGSRWLANILRCWSLANLSQFLSLCLFALSLSLFRFCDSRFPRDRTASRAWTATAAGA